MSNSVDSDQPCFTKVHNWLARLRFRDRARPEPKWPLVTRLLGEPQPGGALPCPRPIREGRASLRAGVGDFGKSPGPGAPRPSHEPQQPGGALLQPRSIREG